ncbi:hypothetical protein SDRG_08801 [Saprolegnia diclina VS20]|uniref:Uncharacterized protein n=1 Tax=Saprolegnia diclina (strain VS20) TaxID=1156394 RepID=T0RTN6_SAPDV|nr:hypothetical protein SDRG_08801 [Saprolegnia diclina VS20]EQC33697.1 hypothetical protein SDRG_08801 [Saprolegnia diclina VS20]|eukprot:XP_008612920.1 hypothetical protein SDRG_08801 [Saprolegnia diclina VS20]
MRNGRSPRTSIARGIVCPSQPCLGHQFHDSDAGLAKNIAFESVRNDLGLATFRTNGRRRMRIFFATLHFHTPAATMMGKDSPFGNLMAEAVKLKGAQQAQLRPVWDAWPTYFQHSMFMSEPIVTLRTQPFGARKAAALEIKQKGNAFFADQQYEEAVAQYEMALSIFKYCENADVNWKKKGIHDDDIRVVMYTPESAADAIELTSLQASLYLNISVCKMRLKEFPVAIVACDDAIALDSTCAKAFYRRAQALITPLSSGAVEFEKALRDLDTACKLDPTSVEIRKLYRQLRDDSIKQKQLDKATFQGMFDRGVVVDTPDEPVDAADARRKQMEQELADANAVVRMYEAKGELESARELQAKIDEAKAAATRAPAPVDFYNPTPDMIADGHANGIDLTDVRVQKMLADLQSEHLANGTTPAASKKPRPRAQLSAFDTALLEADEILPTLSDDEISTLLRAEGVVALDAAERLATARNVLATKLCRAPSPSQTESQDSSQSSQAMKPVLYVVLLWALGRLYSSGGLGMLYNGISDLLSRPSPSPFDGFDEF